MKKKLQRTMRKAHQIAKRLQGDWIARIALALKIAWADERGQVGKQGNLKQVVYRKKTGKTTENIFKIEEKQGKKTANGGRFVIEGNIVKGGAGFNKDAKLNEWTETKIRDYYYEIV